ncbi:hypothetical protein NEOLEDRAFT_1057150 [Neolentinus lepideus HHB14362 ss-1]|uniref:Protein kinase domain-containing protein n=1 Tax=Neolentinus lepideus HHB14362 ss-1 TaxID=1314782 RepID=A0A165V3M8_9AGAM|nr:hypothetical protein NEOLEDRAFT_1057150 [Neolentinus lepideus HHB14362 ss-1]
MSTSVPAEEEVEQPAREPGSLNKPELWWRDHQKWLEQSGYMLRQRYRDAWSPSWKGTGKKWYDCEDGVTPRNAVMLDATRMSDGSLVALKKVHKPSYPYEIAIALLFSSDALASDPRNHCIRIIEVLQVPDDEDFAILVMPYMRKYDLPRFDTFGEVVSFFIQAFEGLQFMHAHLVAHRDCDGRNIMMDGVHLYPQGFHPVDTIMKPDMSGWAKHTTRTLHPVKYYLVDFGLSRRYSAEDLPPREPPIRGGDKSVPEFQHSDEPVDPFPTDVYYLGNMIREGFIQKRYGFEFIEPLVSDMVQDDPSKRPTMDEVVSRFETIRKSLSSWKLRSRIAERDELAIIEFYRAIIHWRRRIGYFIRRIPAVPLP